MNGKHTLRKQVRQLKRQPRIPAPDSAGQGVRIGKWILRENSDGALEAVHSETDVVFLVAKLL